MTNATVEAIDLTNTDLFADGPPRDVFAELLRTGRPAWNPAPPEWAGCTQDGDGFWSVVKAAQIQQVAQDVEAFASGRSWYLNWETDGPLPLEALQGTLTGMDPPLHTGYRNLLNKAFVPHTVRSMEPVIRAQMTAIIDRVAARGACDFVDDVAVPLPTQVIADMLGFPRSMAPEIHDWSVRLASTLDPEQGGGPEGSLAAMQEIIAATQALGTERLAAPREDLLSRLVHAEIDGRRITLEELGALVLQLLVAGNETTRNTLSVGIGTLLAHPDQWEALCARPELAPVAAEEMLRWVSSVYYMRRTATRDVEVGGQRIRRGEKVVQWYVGGNMDPDLNPDPERFDILRPAVKHVTFGGGGRRFCLGAGLARLELKVALEEITRRMPDLRLTGEPRWLRSNFFGGYTSMPVAFTPAAG